ncbi:MAG: sigma-54 dependent transcriptional regulator [bacterium]
MKNSRILIIDDDDTLCYLLKEELISEGYFVEIVYNSNKAIDYIKKSSHDLLLLDLEMNGVSGLDILKFVKDSQPDLQVIVLTANSDMRTAIECIRNGAYDFINKPYQFEQLQVSIERALAHKDLVLKNTILTSKINQTIPHKIIGESKGIKEIIHLAEKAARADSNILLQGETGTGKELFAEYIHKCSSRNEKPLVAINCASLPDQLIESELFGYEKGAFTDAKSSKQGLVEIANGGTLFLDEIGELSLALQPKFLRFLENGEFRRIGGITNLSSNVRVIGATNKNLMEEAEKKNFRRDLLFRLNVITLTIPPLRDRGHDISLLSNYFLTKKSPLRSPKNLSPEAEKDLLSYSFPGNVRELEHIIERAIIFSEDGAILPRDLNLPKERGYRTNNEYDFEDGVVTLEEIERNHILKVLNQQSWNRENSARALGISQKTLYSKIKNYNLQ